MREVSLCLGCATTRQWWQPSTDDLYAQIAGVG